MREHTVSQATSTAASRRKLPMFEAPPFVIVQIRPSLPDTTQDPAPMRPFEHPSNLAKDPRGMTYGKAASLAVGAVAITWYIVHRRSTRVMPSEDINSDVLRPDHGTTQQVGTNRFQQQHRTPPPSKKTEGAKYD